MSPKFVSTAPSDTDKIRERLLNEPGELRARNSVLEESRANRALKALSQCKEAMIRAGDETVLLNDICRIIVDVGGYRMAWIGYIENDNAKTVRPVARAGYDEGYVDYLKIALEDPVRGNGPTGMCLKTGKPYGSRNIRSDEEMRPWREEALKRGYLSTLNLPIVHEKQVIGALVIYSGKVDAFDEEERGLLFELAQTLAYGITAMRDRARRIRAERELKLAKEELEKRVAERTEELRESEERYRGLFESSVDGIAITDIAGNIMKVNPSFQRMLGYSYEELLHVSYQRLTPARWHEFEARIIREHVVPRGYSDEYEKEYIRKDGSVFPISIRTWLIKDNRGRPHGMWAIVRDITERKQAEEASRESEERFRTLADNIPNLAWMANPDGWIFWYNKQWYDYTGTTLEEMQGWGWQKVHHPDHVKAVTEEWSSSINEGKPYDNIFPLRGKDGNYRWFLTRVTPIKDKQGNIQRWFGTNTDITEHKQAEEELAEAQAQAELYLDLMGHDINNMNQVGMGYLEIALDTLNDEGRIEKKDVELLEKPLSAIRDSTRLIDNVRKLRSARSREYQLQPIDLGEVLVSIKEQFSKADGRRITVNYAPAGGRVLATGLVKDVFVNIVGNAVKHSDPDKPLEVNITQIHVYGTDESYHKVIIEDNGPGIPDELKTRIFNRFERGNTKAKGKGLGLYLVKTLVHDFNGRIWVEDRVQGDHTRGSRFVVILPAVEK